MQAAGESVLPEVLGSDPLRSLARYADPMQLGVDLEEVLEDRASTYLFGGCE